MTNREAEVFGCCCTDGTWGVGVRFNGAETILEPTFATEAEMLSALLGVLDKLKTQQGFSCGKMVRN